MRRQVDHPVGQLRHPVIVGGDHHGPPGAGQVAQQPQDPLHLDVVQMGRGLVGHHQRRIVGQGAGDGHPLLLPAGELGRTVVGPFGQPDHIEQYLGPVAGPAPPDPGQPERDDDVAQRREAGDEVEGLEDHAHGLPSIGRQRRSLLTR